MKLVCLLLVFTLLFSTIGNAVAVGVSPARLDIPNILRNGYAEKRFTVSTDSTEILFGHLEAQGQIREWITFPDNNTGFNVSATSPRQLTVTINPPEDIPTGRYTGQIVISGDTTGSLAGRAGSIIQTSVTLSIFVIVTGEEIRSCKAGAFQFNDVERGKPLELWLTIEDSGNVRVSPLVSFDLFDRDRENLLLSDDITSPEILPTQTKRFYLQSLNTLEPGQYWASIDVPECEAESLVTFSVVEKGQIADNGRLVELRAQKAATTLETIPITASFVNTGQRVVTSHLKATVKSGGKIVGVIESDKLAVEPGKSVELEAFFTPQKPGKYEIAGRIVYNEKLTFEKAVTVEVSEPENKESKFPIALLAYAVLIGGAFYIVKVLRKRKFR